MSDTFRLQQLLNLRRQAEEQKAITLATVEAEQQHSLSGLQQLLAQEAAQLASMAETNAGAVDPANAEATRLYLQHLEEAIVRQREQVAAVTARVDASRAELVEATREKRLLERLEERHDETVAAEASRLENARTDEVAAQRFRRRQGMES